MEDDHQASGDSEHPFDILFADMESDIPALTPSHAEQKHNHYVGLQYNHSSESTYGIVHQSFVDSLVSALCCKVCHHSDFDVR